MATKTYYYAYVGQKSCEEHMQVIEKLQEISNGYIAVEHNKDQTKPHIHILFSCNSKITTIQDKLQKKIHLEEVQPIAYTLYMQHKTAQSKEDGKAPYNPNDFFISSKRFATSVGLNFDKLANETETKTKAQEIVIILENHYSMKAIITEAISKGVIDELRRGWGLYKDLREELRQERIRNELNERDKIFQEWEEYKQ